MSNVMMAHCLLVAVTTSLAVEPSVLLEPHCDDSVRIRIAPDGASVTRNDVGALSEQCRQPTAGVSHSMMSTRTPTASPLSPSSVINGRVRVTIDGGILTVSRADTNTTVLTGQLPKFHDASCGHGFKSINMTLVGEPDRVYGLGQLESQNQQRDCSDSGGGSALLCATPLNRREMPDGVTTLSSVKYNIPVGFLYSSSGFGLFFNQPGDGIIALPPGTGNYEVSFACQKQLDMWVTIGSRTSSAADVYQRYADATGPPANLPPYAMKFWQSRDAYENQAEVVALAANFSKLNLTVGVIVIDLGVPSDPPYYRLDPARFPNVSHMVAEVDRLTGARLMPNLKPTSVRSTDCPSCGLGYRTDGKADDGKIDPSSEECRGCVWAKRIKPQLYDQGVEVYWLDDDEGNKFKLPTFECGPAAFCGLWAAGTAWPQVFSDGSTTSGTPPLILSRNVWAGAAALGTALWSSDIECTWTELKAQVLAGLSSGLSGWPFWTSDVGGFFGQTTPELVARWHQFGSVCPLYRTHGSRPGNEPWSFGPETEASIIKSIRLREALHDYLVGLVANTSTTGAPVMRPLWWDFPGVGSGPAWSATDAFMLGPKYLAAPVLDEGVRTRTVWLPETDGGWTHYYTGEHFVGGTTVHVDAPYDELPLFVRQVV